MAKITKITVFTVFHFFRTFRTPLRTALSDTFSKTDRKRGWISAKVTILTKMTIFDENGHFLDTFWTLFRLIFMNLDTFTHFRQNIQNPMGKPETSKTVKIRENQ